jgi:hypothetical protein
MSEHDQRATGELSSEELDTLELMLLESARKAGLPERCADRAPHGGDGAAIDPTASSTRPGEVTKLEDAAPKITFTRSTLEVPSALDDEDAEPLSLRDLERVYEPGEPPPSLADTRPKSVPPRDSAPPPHRASAPPPPPHRASAPPPPPHRASAPPPPPHRASAPPPPPHRASAPPPRLALEPEELDAAAPAALSPTPMGASEPGREPEIEPGPDSARRDLQLLASVRPPKQSADPEFEELMRIHVTPLAETIPGAPGMPKDLLGPEGAAALTGGSVRPRPRAPLKSRAPTDDDPKAVSSEAASIASSAERIDSDLIPPSFRDLAPPSSRPSTAGEGASPKKRTKKKKPAATSQDSSIAPIASTLEPKKPAATSGSKRAESAPSRAPLYVVAAAALLGGGYFIGKLGSEAPPPAASPEHRAQSVQAAPTELGTKPVAPTTAGARDPSQTAPVAAATNGTATSGSEAVTTDPTAPAPPAPIVAGATSTVASPAGSPAVASAAAVSPSAPSTAPASTSTATAPTETATAAPAAPPPAEAAFDKSAASAALAAAAGQASGCKQEGDPSGTARVQVTFVPSGRVTSANVQGPPFAGTATGGCIARAFRSASVPPFSGDPVTVSKTVSIP